MPEFLGQFFSGPAELEVQLLDATRRPDRPALVSEVALQLTQNGPGGEGTELEATIRVEPVDGVDQCHRGHLNQVIVRFAPVGEATS